MTQIITGGRWPRDDWRPILPMPPRKFVNEVLGVWQFNNDLVDLVADNNFIPSTGSASYTHFSKYELLHNEVIARYGLQFEENKTYIVSPNYYNYNNLTIAFWWYSPGLVGFTRHAITRELEPKVAPLFAIGNPVVVAHKVSVSNASIIITEVAYSKTQNAIRVYLADNGSDISHVITSEPFDSPGLHHILVTHLYVDGGTRIDIDGKIGIVHSTILGDIDQSGDLRLNDVVPGYLAHKAIQSGGYMFDLVITNYASSDNEALKMMRYGYEHITDEELFDSRFIYFGLSFPQPSTISTTRIFADGSNIFVTRSDGKVIKGTRPVWDKEFHYPNPESVARLNSSAVGGSKIREWVPATDTTPGGLRLKGVTIRI